MRALRALVLFTLLAWTAANWFHREPVQRTVSPVHATSSIPLSEHLPEKARAALEPCLSGPPPMTMESVVALARERTGVLMREALVKRLVRFIDKDGSFRYLTFRPETSGGQDVAIHLFEQQEEESPKELEIAPALLSMPAEQIINSLLVGAQIQSDLELTHFQGEGFREWSLETENGTPRMIHYKEPGLEFECSSAHGPAACSCSREE